MRVFLFVAMIGLLVSCSTTRTTTTSTPQDTTRPTIERPIVTFGLTTSGYADRPSDAIRLDSSRQMAISTRERLPNGEYKTTNAFAFIEDVDYDTLYNIIERGNLLAVDSTDVGIKCPQGRGEITTLVLKRADRPRALTLIFDECAGEYNLLLEPARTAFVDLQKWIMRFRVKYRPYQP